MDTLSTQQLEIYRKQRWRCRMPEHIRSVFQGTFQHPWQWTSRIATHAPKQGEQWCPRCHAMRHHVGLVDTIMGDHIVDWRPGRHPRYRVDPPEVHPRALAAGNVSVES